MRLGLAGSPIFQESEGQDIEGEPGSYSAYVPELRSILVTRQSLDEITGRAAEAIRVYGELTRGEVPPTATL